MRAIGTYTDLKNRDNWAAVIGPRDCSDKDYETAFKIGYKLAKKAKVVVSGLASGVDTAAHEGALKAGGITIAILSTSIKENIFPKENAALAERIKKQGCLIFPYEHRPPSEKKYNLSGFARRFIERDLLVSILCPNIVVVKNTDEPIKGGTKWATYYGKALDKKVFRIDNNMRFHENPQVQKCSIWTDTEFNYAELSKLGLISKEDVERINELIQKTSI